MVLSFVNWSMYVVVPMLRLRGYVFLDECVCSISYDRLLLVCNNLSL